MIVAITLPVIGTIGLSWAAKTALAVIAPIAARVGSEALRILITALRRGLADGYEAALRAARDPIAIGYMAKGEHQLAVQRISLLLAQAGIRIIKQEINWAIEQVVMDLWPPDEPALSEKPS